MRLNPRISDYSGIARLPTSCAIATPENPDPAQWKEGRGGVASPVAHREAESTPDGTIHAAAKTPDCPNGTLARMEFDADEAFLTNTTREAWPVEAVDGRVIEDRGDSDGAAPVAPDRIRSPQSEG